MQGTVGTGVGISTMLLGMLLAARVGQAASEVPCPDVIVESAEQLDFTATERALMCGEPGVPSWRHVPLDQARYFIGTFLGTRGYHSPRFTKRDERLLVAAGPVTLVTRVTVVNSPFPIDVARHWATIGHPLTPKSLDELTAWLKRVLGDRGYPCAHIAVRGNPANGEITATVADAHFLVFPDVTLPPVAGVNPEVLKRYLAFQPGEEFQALSLDLSARRMVADQTVLNADLPTECAGDGTAVAIAPQLMPGKTRLVLLGVGIDSEEYAVADATWQQTRIGASASSLAFKGHASFVTQSANAALKWYYAPIAVRHYLRLEASLGSERERRFEAHTLTAKVGPAWDGDAHDLYYAWWIGGIQRRIDTVKGIGPDHARALSVAGSGDLIAHDYEYFADDPRSGFNLHAQAERTKRGYASDFSATRATLSGALLENVYDLAPPIWVLAFRGLVTTTQPDADTSPAELPATYRNFLGGASDLRGFGRMELPPDDLGAATVAALGVETRVNEVLPYRLQPVVLADGGILRGWVDQDVERSVFWSPGLGLNWRSPVGVVQATLAHGFIAGPAEARLAYLSRWQVFFSFGEQL